MTVNTQKSFTDKVSDNLSKNSLFFQPFIGSAVWMVCSLQADDCVGEEAGCGRPGNLHQHLKLDTSVVLYFVITQHILL